MEEEKDALALKRSLWDMSPKFGGRNEESVRKKGNFYVPPYTPPPPALHECGRVG